MFFKKYPKLNYKIGGRIISLADIFRSVAFTNVETSSGFFDYFIQDGETPEIVSAKFYGDTKFSWLIMLVNRKIDIKGDWFLSQEQEKNRRTRVFGGDAFYIESLPDIKPGDIIVKVTATGPDGATAVDINTFRYVTEFDPYFRKIRGICGSGAFSTGDTVLFARQNKENGTVLPIEFTDTTLNEDIINYATIHFTESYANSPLYFINSNNILIDGYRQTPTGSTSVNTKTTYSNPGDTLGSDNFASTIIYRYGLCGGTPPYSLKKQTILQDENNKYLKKQKIKVLKPEYVKIVVQSIESAITSNSFGNRIKITI